MLFHLNVVNKLYFKFILVIQLFIIFFYTDSCNLNKVIYKLYLPISSGWLNSRRINCFFVKLGAK